MGWTGCEWKTSHHNIYYNLEISSGFLLNYIKSCCFHENSANHKKIAQLAGKYKNWSRMNNATASSRKKNKHMWCNAK